MHTKMPVFYNRPESVRLSFLSLYNAHCPLYQKRMLNGSDRKPRNPLSVVWNVNEALLDITTLGPFIQIACLATVKCKGMVFSMVFCIPQTMTCPVFNTPFGEIGFWALAE